MSNDILWAEIDISAIKHNFKQVKSLVGDTKIMAVVKADAYGHGAVSVAKALADADYFGVSHMWEGIALRHSGINTPILVILPSLPVEYDELIQNNLTPTVDNIDNLPILAGYGSEDEPVLFHLKLDVGMNRFGISYTDLDKFLQILKEYPSLKLGGVFSHLPNAMFKGSSDTVSSITLFQKSIDYIKSSLTYDFIVHLANSAATIGYAAARFDMVRVGTLLYGQYPTNMKSGSLDLIDPFAVKSKIISIHKASPGQKIGYGGDYKVKKPMTLGVIPIGYTDGFGMLAPQNQVTGKMFIRQSAKLLRNWIWKKPGNVVRYNGKTLPVVGKIAMQTAIIDISNMDIKIGDVVTVPLRRTSLSPLIPKKYINI